MLDRFLESLDILGTLMSLRSRAPAKSDKAADVLIPEKLYFRIGEVAGLCRLPTYVLRFWETDIALDHHNIAHTIVEQLRR